jgi:hypothetical protein
MARLYIFAEGQTEQTFAAQLLRPHLATYGVYVDKPILVAHARSKGRIHRGGGRNYLAMKNDIMRFLKQEKAKDVFFTTMLDLYAIAPEFPGLEESSKLQQNPSQRVVFLENYFKSDIGDHRFIPYLQLHEFEAYLFSEPKNFALIEADNEKAIKELQIITERYETPELINDKPETAPSKRIEALFPDYARSKTIFGPIIAQKTGLSVIRAKCPHFNTWLTQLESLATFTQLT